MTGTNADKIVENFRKIMGPVAGTLARETAREIGASFDGESILLKDGAHLEKFRREFAKRCGKIIGSKLAESVAKQP